MGDLPGHEFHGNQYTTVYHETSESALKSIKDQFEKAMKR